MWTLPMLWSLSLMPLRVHRLVLCMLLLLLLLLLLLPVCRLPNRRCILCSAAARPPVISILGTKDACHSSTSLDHLQYHAPRTTVPTVITQAAGTR
jgi:hypothetical protein